MTPFEYIVGIHTIVLGLATAYLLTTIADTIKYRASISHYWLYTAWCVLVQMLLIGWWFGLWRLMGTEIEITYSRFLIEFAVSVSLFLAVRLLTVDLASEDGIDLKQCFYKVRVPFFIFLGIPYLIALSAGWIFTLDTGTPVGDVISFGAQLLVPIAGILFSNEQVQKVLVFAYGIPYLVVEFQQFGVGFVQ